MQREDLPCLAGDTGCVQGPAELEVQAAQGSKQPTWMPLLTT